MSGINDVINEESILFPINLDPFITNLRSSQKIEGNSEVIENSDDKGKSLQKKHIAYLVNKRKNL